jgi:hypothetical protein
MHHLTLLQDNVSDLPLISYLKMNNLENSFKSNLYALINRHKRTHNLHRIQNF